MQDFGISGSLPNKSRVDEEPDGSYNSTSSFTEICLVAGQIRSCTIPLSFGEQRRIKELARKDQVPVPCLTGGRWDRRRCETCARRQSSCLASNDRGYNEQEINDRNPAEMVANIKLPYPWCTAEFLRVFTCSDGGIGLCCANARVGDFVCELAAGRRLVVRQERGNDWRLIGTATCSHIFQTTEGVPASFGMMMELVAEQRRYLDILRRECSLNHPTLTEFLLRQEAQVWDSFASCLTSSQHSGKGAAMNSAPTGTKVAISLHLWDLIFLAHGGVDLSQVRTAGHSSRLESVGEDSNLSESSGSDDTDGGEILDSSRRRYFHPLYD